MPHHVVVDGSNLATEGRTAPSLKQLNEAVLAYMAEDPTALITVVVDATFGHRIDPKEVAEFDEAVSNNELVAPPAGAIGRGDAFVLSIAHKVNANILTNDSYQEFHAQYDWLFDEGRLIGGKPVPHIGWVFVKRLPVRGPLSRKVTSEAKRKSGGATTRGRGRSEVTDATVRIGSPEANLPMPVPKAPPPRGAAKPADTKADAPASKGRRGRGGDRPAVEAAAVATEAAAAPAKSTVNDLLSFLTFVERHPAGTSVSAVVDHYSSHGAYVRIGDVVGYVPLRLMAHPAPRSAREFMKVGEAVTLVVESFVPAKRSVDLAIPGMGSAAPLAAAAEPTAKPAKATKATKATKASKAGAAVQPADVAAPAAADEAPATPAKPARGGRKAASKGSPAELVDAPSSATPVAPAAPVAPRRAKAAASGGGRGGSRRAPEVPDEPVSDAARRRRSGARLAAAEVAAAAAEAPAPVKKAAAKKAAAAPAAAKKAAAPAKAAAKKAKPAAAAQPKKAAPARRGRTGA